MTTTSATLYLLLGFFLAANLSASERLLLNAAPRVVIHHFAQRVDRGILKWDCPVFAAYNDNTIIWRKDWAAAIDAFSTVESDETSEITRKFETALDRYGGGIFRLTDSSDPEITTVWASGKMLTIMGDWRAPRVEAAPNAEYTELYRKANEHEKSLWLTLPFEIRDILKYAFAFSERSGKDWRPQKLNLLLQPPNRVRVNPTAWPLQWPHAFVVVADTPRVKYVELPGEMLDELLLLLPNDGEPKAVLLNGEARYAELRFVFPGQNLWGRADGVR